MENDKLNYQAEIIEFRLSEIFTQLPDFLNSYPGLECLIYLRKNRQEEGETLIYDRKGELLSRSSDDIYKVQGYYHSAVLRYAFKTNNIC